MCAMHLHVHMKNGKYHGQGERKIGELCYQKESNNLQYSFTRIVKI